ncbi:MAG: hypothetical protein XD76_0863 [candidate division TA06 bacterium 32_111]|uniref:ScoMcrA-like N-terminal head domain-containing protein n=2 Tax=Bacteria candidate phyla TaxID=1783234 RepID=A0A101I587_UNCT6|nr:MAG: hypothetical protein XD76_0863 [candidate division TA06 bacterium 32_111]KUK88185.1 MAG: hypothetical protein XE03_0191 [candidate division TA06 bacterium 34_109]HAF07117.1 hypothetical protein [candidate division WOR-3 bacterium]HCP16072.1 hypothetical protein [candidate division WOR-3 bacterium]
MIPKNIKKEHIIKAIEEIKKIGLPSRRNSKKFWLKYKGKLYPPKHIISLANKYANGKELDPKEFSGGAETNKFLKELGFNIVESLFEKTITKTLKENRRKKISKSNHNERCPKCKETVKELLEKIYGKVEVNYNLKVGTLPEDFKNTPYYEQLKNIYEALQNNRGFKKFVKSKTLPNCDFFVSNQKFIVEFDETQHFTKQRGLTLKNYPEKLELGFDRRRWIELCDRFKSKDNDPPYRDEQRSWYDTIRDFLPSIKEDLKPTVRLFSKDYVWCSFDPKKKSDVKRFEKILKGDSENWEIEEIREETNPSIARVIIKDEWEGNFNDAKRLLENICEKWPKDRKVKFLITCGGFIQFDWPKSISQKDIGDNKNPNENSLKKLLEEAENLAKNLLNCGLDKKLSKFTDYITLGIDTYKEKISKTNNYIGNLHAELVVLVDLRNKKFYLTGKSYPTSNQQKGLVRITDLKTHFFDLDDVGKLMILGCNDLTIFNPRSKNAKGWRKDVRNEFLELAKSENPKIVLQHPHTTVKKKTWLNAWNGLRKTLPSVEIYSSSGRYYESDRLDKDCLDDILKSTKKGNTSTIDFIIKKISIT